MKPVMKNVIHCPGCETEVPSYRKVEYVRNREYHVDAWTDENGISQEVESRIEEYPDDVLEVEYTCIECGGDLTEEVDEFQRQAINALIDAFN